VKKKEAHDISPWTWFVDKLQPANRLGLEQKAIANLGNNVRDAAFKCHVGRLQRDDIGGWQRTDDAQPR
jgi:hypothetical protein